MASRFWVGGTGTWTNSSTTVWSATSGGASGASVPVSADDVFFDAASGAGTAKLASGLTASIKGLNFTGFTGDMLDIGATSFSVSGNVTFVAGMTVSSFPLLQITGSSSLTTAGKNLNGGVFVTGAFAQLALADAVTISGDITLGSGTLNTAGFAVSCNLFDISGSIVRSLTLGSSIISITGGGGTVWSAGTTTNLTFNPNTSTIKLTGASPIFTGGGLTYNNYWFAGSGSSTISGSNTFADLKIDAGLEQRFTAGTTQTITTLTATGTAGNLITLRSSSASSTWTISKASGTVTATYCSITDSIATGGATFNATQSINGGNNTGWNFVIDVSWLRPLTGPISKKKGLGSPLQRYLSFTPIIVQENVTLDKWFNELSEPVRIKPGLGTEAQRANFLVRAAPFAPTTPELSFYRPLSEPVRLPKGMRVWLQDISEIVQFSPFTPAPPELSWFRRLSEPVRFRRLGTAQNPFMTRAEFVPFQYTAAMDVTETTDVFEGDMSFYANQITDAEVSIVELSHKRANVVIEEVVPDHSVSITVAPEASAGTSIVEG